MPRLCNEHVRIAPRFCLRIWNSQTVWRDSTIHAFDVITLVDVLEHLKDPIALLHRLERLLAPQGRLLLSVPNVAHASVRLELLNGQFDYETTGILNTTT